MGSFRQYGHDIEASPYPFGADLRALLGRRVKISTPLAAALLVGICVGASAHVLSPDQQVRHAWERFRVAYVSRSARTMCSMLTPSAQADLEDQAATPGCAAAARRWFVRPEFDRAAAVQARLIRVHISGQAAEIIDTDPNDPAASWTKYRGRWKVASFFLMG